MSRDKPEAGSQRPARDRWERPQPLDLDVLASELRRQSEMRPFSDSQTDESSRYHVSEEPASTGSYATEGGFGAVDSGFETPIESAPGGQDARLEQLMQENADLKAALEILRNGQAPRKSSDILSDRLLEIRRRADEADRERERTQAQNRELRDQVKGLRDALEQHIDNIRTRVGAGDDSEAVALRRELELVRARAAADLDSLRAKLHESAQGRTPRDVDREAELQATRQEADLLRQSVLEKANEVENLAAQCRRLEDAVEDRDRELESLGRQMDALRTGGGAVPASKAEPRRRGGFQEPDTTDVLDGTSLVYLAPKRDWKGLALIGAAGILLGALVVAGAVLYGGATSSSLSGAQTVSPPPQETVTAPAETPATSAPVPAAVPPPAKVAAAAPLAGGATQAPAPQVIRDRLSGGGLAPELVPLSGGRFVMGSRKGVHDADEQPAHPVTVGAVAIGRYEVTFDEYDRFAKATGRTLPDDSGWGRGSRPVVNVTWDDARAYARWLSQQTGKTYRLPSEAEWEYAAGAAGGGRYWWGFQPEPGRAVCFDCGTTWDNRSTAPVGSLPASPSGLYDMAGNALEWVEDCYNGSYQGAPEDGRAWLAGDCSQRMARGGAFNKPLRSLRNASRYHFPKDVPLNMVGFRLVRED